METLHAYEPLATNPGELEELERLRVVLGDVLSRPASTLELAGRFEHLQSSLERLSEINARAVHHADEQNEASHRNTLVAQIIAALVTLGAAGVIAAALSRVMRRQRWLLARGVERLYERNRDLAAFASRTAHDLRAPLSPMRGYADLLAFGAPVDNAKVAERIRKAVERMSALIEDLLALSLSGQVQPGETEVAPLVREVVAELAPALSDAGVVTSLEDCRAACPPAALHRILVNLLENASKYRSPARRLSVRIDARRIDSQIELAVEDNGRGMAPAAVARAFEPFYRAPEVQSQPGSGLGLSIVQRTIDSLEGTCELTSDLDRGTRIVIRVPAAGAGVTPGPTPGAATVHDPDRPARDATPRGAGATV
jgi:signal transduction histidine kinase